MNGIVAENGNVVTDDMIADWESALERDEWPSGWVNVGEIVEGMLPKAEGKSTGAYARGILADGLMAIE